MFAGSLSRRAKRVILEARREAGQRGAESIEPNDLVVALIVEDQDSESLDLDPQHPAVQNFLHSEPRPLAALFPKSCWKSRVPFFAKGLATDLLRMLKKKFPNSANIPHTAEMRTSPEFERAFEIAEQLRHEFNQSEVYPVHLLAAVLREPCEATQTLGEAGITEEKVLQAIRAGGDLETGVDP